MSHDPKTPRLILGSASPRRKDLLAQIGITPDLIHPADINEDPHKAELPQAYVQRIAREKNDAIAKEFPHDAILTADTTLAVGRRIFGKPDDRKHAEMMLTLMSGRAHRILTAVVLRHPDGRVASRLSNNRVQVKRLSDVELQKFLDTNDWEGKAGAYAFQGHFAQYIRAINGTASGIVGLPLFETAQMLKGFGLI